MKAIVNKDVCIGAAMCIAAAPGVFDLNAEGKSHVIDPDGGTDDELRRAAEDCPVQAIRLEDDQGNTVYP